MKKEKVYFQNSGNQKLCGIIFIPDGDGPFPVVIACHGLASSKELSSLTMAYPQLIKNKIAVFAFDFSGHGESNGKFEDVTISQAVDDLRCALNYIEKRNFINKEKIGLLGSSFGGITSIFVSAEDKRIKVLALKAPLIDFKFSGNRTKNVKEWRKKGYIVYHSKHFGDMRLGYPFYLDGIKYNAIKIAKKIKVPTLVVVGDKDITVFSRKVKEFFDSLRCKKEIHLIKGAKHHFTEKESKQLFNYFITWFIKNLE